MKKIILLILTLFCFQSVGYSEEAPAFYTAANQVRRAVVFGENNLFGLKDNDGNIIVHAKYRKMVMTGRNGWIVQKGSKYGLMDSDGNWLIEPKYRNADRIFGRYIKLGNDHDFGIYNEFGETILPPEYSGIELLYGRMFLTYKDFRYGVSDFDGNVLIPNICDDIYMPTRDTMRIKYLGLWYEIDNVDAKKLAMPELPEDEFYSNMSFKDIMIDTGAVSGYSVLTFSDYIIKFFSSISPAHEATIDELLLSHGVDTVGILMNFSWLPKYPATFIKNYVSYFANPFNGPLSDTRNKLKTKRETK